MTEILVVSGSPVVESSTDILLARMASAVSNNLKPAESSITTVRINDLQFKSCQACGEAPTPEFCFYEDDLTPVYRKLSDCDCLLFGSPIHFDAVSSQAKLFIDRCNCFRPADFDNADPEHDFIKLLKRKRPGAMVLVGGESAWFEGARRCIAGFFKWIDVVNDGMVTHMSTDFNRKGSVVDDEPALALADEIGAKIANAIREGYDRQEDR